MRYTAQKNIFKLWILSTSSHKKNISLDVLWRKERTNETKVIASELGEFISTPLSFSWSRRNYFLNKKKGEEVVREGL